METATPVIPVMEYATNVGLGVDRRCAAVAVPLLGTAILSGLCVGVCFVTLALDMSVPAAVLHSAVFFATLALGTIAGMRMGDGYGVRMIGDCLAGAGLLGISVAPWIVTTMGSDFGRSGAAALGMCYLLMAATTVRHLMMYRMLATWLRNGGRTGAARGLVALGWTKTIYEAIWLGCCVLTLAVIGTGIARADDLIIALALGSFFGCFGYGVIWIWMIVAHAMLVRESRRR